VFASFPKLLSPLPFAVLFLTFSFLIIAGFLVWYALRHKDFVRAKFARGKTTFELEAGKNKQPDLP
jgi:hypothetical protein